VAGGAQVDNAARGRALPDVAAGRVRGATSPITCTDLRRLRVEHWNNGYQQGAAARSLLGSAALRLHPLLLSDQYEHLIAVRRFAASWDRLVFRGRPESRKFLGFYLKTASFARSSVSTGGDPEDPKVDGELKTAVRLIRSRAAIDPAKLADEDVDLRGLSSPRRADGA